MDISLLRDYLGLFAPVILLLSSIVLLFKKKIYLNSFVFGFIFNNILNVLLKLLIKEPRPADDSRLIEIGVAHGKRIGPHKFGMPSGHAQNCGFCLIFITLVLDNPNVTSIYVIITFISMYQRYLYNNHTILQLIIGLLVGLGFGYVTYLSANMLIRGNIKGKKDDNGPF